MASNLIVMASNLAAAHTHAHTHTHIYIHNNLNTCVGLSVAARTWLGLDVKKMTGTWLLLKKKTPGSSARRFGLGRDAFKFRLAM